MSTCCGVNVVQTSRLRPPSVWGERQPRPRTVDRDELGPRWRLREDRRIVRNIPAHGDSSPRATTSWNATESAETWLTMTSTDRVEALHAPHVAPAPEARVDDRVVDRVEAGIGTVVRCEERQDVHAPEDAVEPLSQESS